MCLLVCGALFSFKYETVERMLHPTQKWICLTLVQLFGEFSVRNLSVRKAETSIIKEYNPSVHIFNVAIVHCSYMFWLPQSNYLLAVYQKRKKEFIWHAVSGQAFGLTEGTGPSAPGLPYYRGFTITLRHTTLGRTPLDEWSAQCRDFYLTTHNTHKRQISLPPAGFEPTIPAIKQCTERHALDHAAIGIGSVDTVDFYKCWSMKMFIKFNTVLIVFARVCCSKHSFSKVTQVVCIQGSRYNLKKDTVV